MPPRANPSTRDHPTSRSERSVESIMALVPGKLPVGEEHDGVILFERTHLGAVEDEHAILLGGLQALAFSCVRLPWKDVCSVALQTHKSGARFYFANNGFIGAGPTKDFIDRTLMPRLSEMARASGAVPLALQTRSWAIEVLSHIWDKLYHRNTRRPWPVCRSRLSDLRNAVADDLIQKVEAILTRMHAINAADAQNRLHLFGNLYDDIAGFQDFVIGSAAKLVPILGDADKTILSTETIGNILKLDEPIDDVDAEIEQPVTADPPLSLTFVKRSYQSDSSSDTCVTRFVVGLFALATHASKLATFVSSPYFNDKVKNPQSEYCADTQVMVNIDDEQGLAAVTPPGTAAPKYRCRRARGALRGTYQRSLHAEMKLALKFIPDIILKQPGDRFYPVLGNSKLCCWGCWTFFQVWTEAVQKVGCGDILPEEWVVSGTHGKVYMGYSKPDLSSINTELSLHLDAAFKARVVDEFQQLQLIQHNRYNSDSTNSPPAPANTKAAVQVMSQGGDDKYVAPGALSQF